jgi:hypothetical protein
LNYARRRTQESLGRRIRLQLQRNLFRRARTTDNDGSGPALYHRSVYMPAKESFDIAEATQNLCYGLGHQVTEK